MHEDIGQPVDYADIWRRPVSQSAPLLRIRVRCPRECEAQAAICAEQRTGTRPEGHPALWCCSIRIEGSEARKMIVVLLLHVVGVGRPPIGFVLVALKVAGICGRGQLRFYRRLQLTVVELLPINAGEPGMALDVVCPSAQAAQSLAWVGLTQFRDDVSGVGLHCRRIFDLALDNSRCVSRVLVACPGTTGSSLLVDFHRVLVPERGLSNEEFEDQYAKSPPIHSSTMTCASGSDD